MKWKPFEYKRKGRKANNLMRNEVKEDKEKTGKGNWREIV